MDAKRPTPRHIIIKLPKIKRKILKTAKEKKLGTFRRVPIRLSAYFSKETLQARKDWQEIFKVMLSFRIDGADQELPRKKKLKEFIITKPVLYEMLKAFN